MMLAALLSGCDGGLAPDGHDELCPTCVPRSGGETSDFGGGSECRFEEYAIPDQPELQAELETTLAAYAGPFQRTLRWSAPDATTPITADETTIRGNIEFGAGTYFVGDPVECGDFVQVKASTELETADGGVEATSQGALTLQRTDGTSQVAAASDLSTVRGKLDLRIESSEPHVGRLTTVITANGGGLEGTVTIEVSYFPDRESAEAYARGERVASTSEFQVIGTFSAE